MPILFGNMAASGDSINEVFQPAGTSRVVALSFKSGLTTVEAGSTLTVTQIGSPSLTTGLVDNGVTNFLLGGVDEGRGIRINSLPVLNGVSYTFVAWYKGTITATRADGSWSPCTPIFGDPRGSVYIGFGIEDGRAAFTERASIYGIRNIADNQWHMFTYIFNGGANRVSMYVDGYLEAQEYKSTSQPVNNRADYIGQGYAYSDTAPISTGNGVIDGVQVYNQVLTQSHIREIYNAGVGTTTFTATSPYIAKRYWRMRAGSSLGHHPRASRVTARDFNGSYTNFTVFTSDNCGDSGTIVASGYTTNYDAGAGNTKSFVGGGIYVVCGAGCERDGWWYLEYSDDNSNWTILNKTHIKSHNGCGLYLTDGLNAG